MCANRSCLSLLQFADLGLSEQRDPRGDRRSKPRGEFSTLTSEPLQLGVLPLHNTVEWLEISEEFGTCFQVK